MRKEWGNPLVLSSERLCQGWTDYRQEQQRLHVDLEGGRDQTQWPCGRLRLELQRLREEAEEEHQRALKELASKEGQKKKRHSDRQRCLQLKATKVKESGRRRESRWTRKGSVHLFWGETYAKLEQLLLLLYERTNSEQPVVKLRHREQLELKKALLLCNLLQAQGKLLQEKQRVDYPACIFRHYSRKHEDDDPDPLITYSRALPQRSHSALHSVQEKPKQDQQEGPLRSALPAADPHTATTAWDTCQTASLKICHPPSTTHAGWDDQRPCCTEFFRSEETTPSKCTYRNMEVSYFTFTNPTHLQKSYNYYYLYNCNYFKKKTFIIPKWGNSTSVHHCTLSSCSTSSIHNKNCPNTTAPQYIDHKFNLVYWSLYVHHTTQDWLIKGYAKINKQTKKNLHY